MKILMLGWELPPHNSGGLGVACLQLCEALARKGADIEFVPPYSAEHPAKFMNVHAAYPQNVSEVIKSGIAYDSYKYVYNDGHEEWMSVHQQQQIFEQSVPKLVDELEFDVIHAHDWLTFRAAVRAKEQTGKPMILHVHSIESDRAGGGRGNPLVREIESLSLMMADKVIAVSNHTKKAIIREYAIPANKIEVVHNSIDLSTIETSNDENIYQYLTAMKRNGYRVVVNIGRLTMQKVLPNFLRAAQKVITVAPKTLFLIVGSGEQHNELLELSAELGVSKNVIFTGFQRGKAWRDAYKMGDLFVMPSISEPFGLTPLEAIGYGTPTLISKQSGVSEVLINSLKVDYWDITEMANKIAAVVMNDALRDELHANSLREYSRLSWNNAADKLMDVYKSHKIKAYA